MKHIAGPFVALLLAAAAPAQALAHIEIPVAEQARLQGLVRALGAFQFYGNANARDIAESNAFVKVLLQAKRWTARHGSLEAEDGRGNGFGARTIVSRALMDEGRAQGRRSQLPARNPGEEDTKEDDSSPPETEAPEDETVDRKAGGQEQGHEVRFDPSDDDPERAQAAFEGVPGGPNVEGTSFDTPRKRAQDAQVDRNVAELTQNLTPYQRRMLELWHDTPDNPDLKFPSWANAVGKEWGRTKAEVLDDFQALRDQLKAAAQQRGLTKDDFTRITSSPKPEEAPYARDERFATETDIGPGRLPETTGRGSFTARRAQEIRAAAYEVRDRVSRVVAEEKRLSGGTSRRGQADLPTAFREALARSPAQVAKLAKGTMAEKALAKAIQRFREYVPLVSRSKIDDLTAVPPSFGQVARDVTRQYGDGQIPEAYYARALQRLGERLGLTDLPRDLDAAAQRVQAAADRHDEAQNGAPWVQLPSGMEAKAYRDDSNGAVYKVLPHDGEMLDVRPVKGDEPLYPSDDAKPLESRTGGMPAIDRLVHYNETKGHAKTELVGLTDTGELIYKQPDLGDAQPTADQVRQSALDNGHQVLPPQADDPSGLMGGDASVVPILSRGSGAGPVLHLDANPRNSRLVNGRAIPFDTVTRELTPEEVASHPQLRAAAAKLRRSGLPAATESARPDEPYDDEGRAREERRDEGDGGADAAHPAAAHLRRNEGADREKLGDYRTRGEQARQYLAYAEHAQRVLPADYFPSRIRLGVAGEHEIYRDGDRVLKVTKNAPEYDNGTGIARDYRATPYQYLNRFALANRVFGDDTRWEGLQPLDGHLRTVTSQSFREGEPPSAAEVTAKLNSLGFTRVSGGDPLKPEDDGMGRDVGGRIDARSGEEETGAPSFVHAAIFAARLRLSSGRVGAADDFC